MNVNLSVYYSYLLLLMSVLVGVSSGSLFNLWLMLEINSVLFLLIMITTSSLFTSASLTKYFIVQAVSSMVLLIGVIYWPQTGAGPLAAQASMVVKLGAIPGHMWYVSIIQDLSWVNIFMLSTMQKILPLMGLIVLTPQYMMITLFALSATAAFLATMSSTLKRLIGYSGILNVSWLMAGSWSWASFSLFFLLYFFSMGALSLHLSISGKGLMFDSKSALSYTEALAITGILFSLAGLPPFFGFWGKLVILKLMLTSAFPMSIFTYYMAITSAWMVYIYVGLIDGFLMKSSVFGAHPLKHSQILGLLSYLIFLGSAVFLL